MGLWGLFQQHSPFNIYSELVLLQYSTWKNKINRETIDIPSLWSSCVYSVWSSDARCSWRQEAWKIYDTPPPYMALCHCERQRCLKNSRPRRSWGVCSGSPKTHLRDLWCEGKGSPAQPSGRLQWPRRPSSLSLHLLCLPRKGFCRALAWVQYVETTDTVCHIPVSTETRLKELRCMDTCTCTHIYTYMNTYTYTNVCTRTHIHTYIDTYIHILAAGFR